jgi:hypothetical protein
MNRGPRDKSTASPSHTQSYAPYPKSVTPPAPPAQRVRPGMFASPLHAAQRLIEEQLACRDPVFAGILGDAKVEAKIDAAKDRARFTPNFGYGRDVAANGSEHGFYAGKIPLFGAATGRVFTNHREVETNSTRSTSLGWHMTLPASTHISHHAVRQVYHKTISI